MEVTLSHFPPSSNWHFDSHPNVYAKGRGSLSLQPNAAGQTGERRGRVG